MNPMRNQTMQELTTTNSGNLAHTKKLMWRPVAVGQGSHDLGVCIFAVCWDLACQTETRHASFPSTCSTTINSSAMVMENKQMINLYRKPSKSASMFHFQHIEIKKKTITLLFPASPASRSLSRPERFSYGIATKCRSSSLV